MGYTSRNNNKDRQRSGRHDPELRQYREERPARVGGMNRQHDGSHWDYTNTERSDISSRPLNPANEQQKKPDNKRREKERKAREAKAAKEAKQREKDAARKQKEAARAASKKKTSNSNNNKAPNTPSTPSKANLLNPSGSANNTPTKPHRGATYNNHHDEDNMTELTATSYSQPYTNASSAQQSDSYYSSYRPHAVPDYPVPPPMTTTPPQVGAGRHHRSRDSGHGNGSGTPRASGEHSRNHSRTRRSGSASPRKQHRGGYYESGGERSRQHSRSRPVAESSSYTATSDSGTKVYPCHIPGLSSSSSSNGGGGGGGARDGIERRDFVGVRPEDS
ncbi:hypothetical protein LTS18_008677, partial [Coniosporium uncinatum]